ncbi:MAG TPA: hypothetical protein VGK78_02300, partial [Nocardioides sp.]|uniref:hypothetical protein n=1 Tax=Nocardioides sp. TaxID=35761 RepID=UPI002F423224
LVVNSKKMVKHLNANLVGGQTAAQLNPKLLRWHLGAVGTTFANGASDLFKVTVPKGTYQVTLSGLLVQSGASTTDSWQCLAVDYHKLLDNPSSPDISGIWALGGHQWSDWDAAVLDYTSAPITLTQPRAMLYGCQFSGTTGTITAYQPPTFVFHKVTVANQTQGSPVVLPKSATSHLRLPR